MKWRRLGLLWIMKMALSTVKDVVSGVDLFTVFVVVDQRVPLAGHTIAHTSVCGPMEHHLLLWLPLDLLYLMFTHFHVLAGFGP